MKAPQFRELRIKDLKQAPWNPPGRITHERIRDLIDSMSLIGLIYPIVVTEDLRMIIEGHRRVAAAKELGWDTIPAMIGRGDPKAIYAGVNHGVRKMAGNEALNVWLKEPDAVAKQLGGKFATMSDCLGRARLAKMCKEGYSLKLWYSAIQLVRYLDRSPDVELTYEIVDWMMEHRVTSTVKQAIAMGHDGNVILRAVRAGRPLTFKLAMKGG